MNLSSRCGVQLYRRKYHFMRKTIVFSTILLTVTLVAFAAPKAQKLDLTLSAPTTVAGVQLKAGDYKVELSADNTVATFYQGSAEVAKVSVHGQTNGSKYRFTELDRANQTLKEIHVGGTTTNLVIDGPAKSAAAGGSR